MNITKVLRKLEAKPAKMLHTTGWGGRWAERNTSLSWIQVWVLLGSSFIYVQMVNVKNYVHISRPAYSDSLLSPSLHQLCYTNSFSPLLMPLSFCAIFREVIWKQSCSPGSWHPLVSIGFSTGLQFLFITPGWAVLCSLAAALPCCWPSVSAAGMKPIIPNLVCRCLISFYKIWSFWTLYIYIYFNPGTYILFFCSNFWLSSSCITCLAANLPGNANLVTLVVSCGSGLQINQTWADGSELW